MPPEKTVRVEESDGPGPGVSMKRGSGQGKPSRRYDPILPPCKVCGSKASGYHFGAITCEACKVFFRRSLGKENDYKCSKNDNCPILSVRRMSCSSCRLQKCKDMGMSRDGIQKGRYTLEKKTDCIREARELEDKRKQERSEVMIQKGRKYDQEKENLIQYLLELDQKNVLYSKELLDSLPEREERYKENEELRFELFGPLRPIPHETYREIYTTTGIDLDNRKTEIGQCISHGDAEIIPFIKFAKGIPGFQEIALEDQMMMLKVSSYYWWLISSMDAINLEHCLFTCPSCGLTLGYDDMLKWITVDGIIEFCRFLQFLKALKLSKEEIALLKGIAVLDTDYCGDRLKDRALIDKKKEKLVETLRYYVERNRSDQPNMFAKMMRSLVDAQAGMHEYQKMMDEWFQIWPDLHYPPLLKELCSDFPINENPKSRPISPEHLLTIPSSSGVVVMSTGPDGAMSTELGYTMTSSSPEAITMVTEPDGALSPIPMGSGYTMMASSPEVNTMVTEPDGALSPIPMGSGYTMMSSSPETNTMANIPDGATSPVPMISSYTLLSLRPEFSPIYKCDIRMGQSSPKTIPVQTAGFAMPASPEVNTSPAAYRRVPASPDVNTSPAAYRRVPASPEVNTSPAAYRRVPASPEVNTSPAAYRRVPASPEFNTSPAAYRRVPASPEFVRSGYEAMTSPSETMTGGSPGSSSGYSSCSSTSFMAASPDSYIPESNHCPPNPLSPQRIIANIGQTDYTPSDNLINLE